MELAAADPVDQHPHRAAALARRDQRVDRTVRPPRRRAGYRWTARCCARPPRSPAASADRPRRRSAAARTVLPPSAGRPVRRRTARSSGARWSSPVRARRLPRGDRAVIAPHADPRRAALHPVDAEHEIERPADRRRQPAEPDPADRRADLALGEQHVPGDGERDHQVEHDERPRPDLRRHLQQPLEQPADHASPLPPLQACERRSPARRCAPGCFH